MSVSLDDTFNWHCGVKQNGAIVAECPVAADKDRSMVRKENPPEGGLRKVPQWVCQYQSAAHVSAVFLCKLDATPTVSWLGSADASTIRGFRRGVRIAI
ncbi:hypothetical protein Q2941_51485 [Bradyrhizobium sp. UFLA05-153]|uniref:hypothetical protein n=1 Tax=Bradyrhizobium sp. Ec3.3 TaxID=189753 RepID=UPI0018DEA020|nr:hypothetical protein [Bradyrhizobium sp. Ec3.3]